MKLTTLTKIKLVVVCLLGFMYFVSESPNNQSVEKNIERTIDNDTEDQARKFETESLTAARTY